MEQNIPWLQELTDRQVKHREPQSAALTDKKEQNGERFREFGHGATGDEMCLSLIEMMELPLAVTK